MRQMIPRRAFCMGLLVGLAACGNGTYSKSFVSNAIQTDIADVHLGALARDNATRAEVRQFGATLVSDHRASEDEAQALAGELGIRAPTEATQKSQDEFDKLLKLSGAAFDTEFVRYMVDDHTTDFKQFTEAAKSNDSRIASFARKTLPMLQEHLKTAHALIGNN